MLTWVALLKGVNVGGHNKVPMADLRAAALARGWHDVRTYLASGNLVFEADEATAEDVKALLPVDVPVFVNDAPNFSEIVAGCPFAPTQGKLVHGFLCRRAPVLDEALLAKWRSDEEVAVMGRVIWLHTPSGFSRSKVAEKLAQIAGEVEMTGRNLNTLRKLVDMCGFGG